MNRKSLFPTTVIGASLLAVLVGPLDAADKLSLEQVIEKHLASIASPDVLASRTAMAGSALVKMDILVGGGGHLEGATLVGSEDSRMMVLMDFNQSNYQVEHLIADRQDAQIAFIRPGNRSPLGEFLFTYKYLLKDGLFGGSLSTMWPLLDPDFNGAKVKYRGVKKVDGVKAHLLEYTSKGGKDVEIKIFLDETTFRHVRTEYEVVISPIIPLTPGLSSQQRVTRTTVVESFGGFQETDGVTTPTNWGIHYQRTGNENSITWRWNLTFNKLAVNQLLDENYFKLGARFSVQ